MLSVITTLVLIASTPHHTPVVHEAPVVGPVASAEDDGPTPIPVVDLPWIDADLDIASLEEGKIGLNYKIERIWTLGEEDKPESNYRIKLSSKGYLADGDAQTQDSMVTSLEFGGEFISYDATRGTSTQGGRAARVKKLRDLYAELDPDEGEMEFQGSAGDFSDQIDRLRGKTHVRYLSWSGRFRHESDQAFNNQQYVLGLGLSTDSTMVTGDNTLARWLDMPFKALRSPESKRKPRPIRAYLGVDVVDASGNGERRLITDDEDYARVTTELAWATTILNDSLFQVRWEGFWELGADAATKAADQDSASFVEASVSLPVGGNGTSLLLQYSEGRLPPFGEKDSVVGAGLRVSF